MDRHAGRNGLHRLKPALFTTFGAPESAGHLNVYSTYVDRTGAIWVGSWSNFAGMRRIDSASNHMELLGKEVVGDVNSFLEDDAGRLWVGAIGVYACELSGTMCRAEGAPDLRDREVFALYADSSGLWAGASRRLFRYDGRRWSSFPSASGAPDATVRAFATTHDGALWMGTNGGGLARYRNGRFSRVTREEGLPSDLIRSLYTDGDDGSGSAPRGAGSHGSIRAHGTTVERPRRLPSFASLRQMVSLTTSSTRFSKMMRDGSG